MGIPHTEPVKQQHSKRHLQNPWSLKHPIAVMLCPADRCSHRSGLAGPHRPRTSRLHAWLLPLWVGVVASQAEAATVTLHPVADTTLFQTFPDNNYGRFSLVAGTTAEGQLSRALVKFNPGTNLPPGAVISSVQLTFRVNRAPHTPVTSTFDLHRMLVDWREGTGGSGSQQTRGAPAAKANESTWNAQFSPSTPWTDPGASAPHDFADAPSASAPLAGTSLVFASTSKLIADLQSWIDNPGTNFGWILISESEDIPGTARRFNSRETSTTTSPTLLITYTTPKNPPAITSPPQDQAVFSGENATFSVVASGSLPLTYQWSLNLAAVSGATNATLTVTNAQALNAGGYIVTISNAVGTITSAPAHLILASAPVIQPVTLTGGVLNLNFAAIAAHNYLVQFSESLPATNWQTLTNIPASTVATNILVSDPTSASRRFYRLEALAAP